MTTTTTLPAMNDEAAREERLRQERLRQLQLEDLGLARFKAIAEDDFPEKRASPRMSLQKLEASRACNIPGTKEYKQAQSVKGLLSKWAAFGGAVKQGDLSDDLDDIAAGQTHRLTGLVQVGNDPHGERGFRRGRGRGRGARGGGVFGTRGRGVGLRKFDRAPLYDEEEKHRAPGKRRTENDADTAFLDSIMESPRRLPVPTSRDPILEPKKPLAATELQEELQDQDHERKLTRLQNVQEKAKAKDAPLNPDAALISKWHQYQPTKPTPVQSLKALKANQPQVKKEPFVIRSAKRVPTGVQTIKEEPTIAKSIKKEPIISQQAKGEQAVAQQAKVEQAVEPKVKIEAAESEIKMELLESPQAVISTAEEATELSTSLAQVPTAAGEVVDNTSPIDNPPTWVEAPENDEQKLLPEFSGDSFVQEKLQDDLVSPATLISFDDAEGEAVYSNYNGTNTYNDDLAGLEVLARSIEQRKENQEMEGIEYSTGQGAQSIKERRKATIEDLRVLTKTLAKFDMDLSIFLSALPKSAVGVIIDLVHEDEDLTATLKDKLQASGFVRADIASTLPDNTQVLDPASTSSIPQDSQAAKMDHQMNEDENWTLESAWNKIMSGGLEASKHANPNFRPFNLRSDCPVGSMYDEQSSFHAPHGSHSPYGEPRAGNGNSEGHDLYSPGRRRRGFSRPAQPYHTSNVSGQDGDRAGNTLPEKMDATNLSPDETPTARSSTSRSSVMESKWATKDKSAVRPSSSDWTRGQRLRDPLFRGYDAEKKRQLPLWLQEKIAADELKDKAEGKENVSAAVRQYDQSDNS